MNISESTDLFKLLRWLGADPHDVRAGAFRPERPTDEDAASALLRLGQRAGVRLQLPVYDHEAAEAFERLRARLAAADSDGAAQAVCHALDRHERHHGGSIPWPSVRQPLEGWRAARARHPEPAGLCHLDGEHYDTPGAST